MNGKNCRHSPRATLAAVGLKLQALQLLAPIREKVKIAQKKIKHEPLDKLQDALITILAGAHGLCEINTRLRADQALQRAFGREARADQSVVQARPSARPNAPRSEAAPPSLPGQAAAPALGRRRCQGDRRATSP